jgi:hypothetical protein
MDAVDYSSHVKLSYSMLYFLGYVDFIYREQQMQWNI